ncbi:uncharacterized protein LOC115885258 [Sitophilus oryzae]|uniref:Uncharacterized protein LOC115885258 n=1 Tax=Sitophilus oryzae TaxID=7048 RepID=A0A6J2Y9P9_SITOR|nr:uncharacterized protein LOC115885258 [Sitophilus oryzae]
MEKFIVIKDSVKKVPRFGLTGRKTEFKIKPVPNGEDPIKWTKGAIEDILKKGVEGVAPSDQVGINFCSKDFTRGDGWINFKPASGVTFDDVWKMISGIYQSNSTGLNTETFCLDFARDITGYYYPGEDFAYILSPQPAPGPCPPQPLEQLWADQVGEVFMTIWADTTDKVVYVYYTTAQEENIDV